MALKQNLNVIFDFIVTALLHSHSLSDEGGVECVHRARPQKRASYV